jgi:hypothetical protein
MNVFNLPILPAALGPGVHSASNRNECQKQNNNVGFEVFTAVAMKNAVFWDVTPYGFIINGRFGGTYLFFLQGRRNNASEETC